MPSRRSLLSLTLVLAASLPCAGAAFAKDAAKLSVPLSQVGSDGDISGSMRFQGSPKGNRFEVRVSNAAEDADATLRVGGVDRLTLPTNSGNVKFSFRSPANGGSVPLNFDPRGEAVEVWVNGEAQLANTLAAGSGGGGSGKVSEESSLTNTGAIPGASGRTRIREKRGVVDFDVEIEDVPNGSYDLFVDGVDRGDIVVSGGEGEIEFSDGGDDPDELPLTFDPYGALVEVKQGATVILTGSTTATTGGGAGGGGGNVCGEEELRLDLVNVGPDPNAKGDARHRVRDDCDRDFRVEVENLPLGTYDLFVGGVDRGDIQVVLVMGEEEGEIEFDTDPNEVGKELLTFDPRGQLIEVKQGATVFLSLDF
jgi:hypothetical protein